jgi:rod shape-determining protein MreC
MGGGISDALLATQTDYKAWQSEKAQLQAQLAEQQAQLAELQQLRENNKQLYAYLGLVEKHTELILTEARVIYRADTTERLLTVNRGRRDGVKIGMPVIDESGLVGRVCEVSASTAKVATLLDELLSVGVRNVRSGVSGVLCGAVGDGEVCTLKYLDANINYALDLQVGDMIVTSGSSDLYPEGLLVGSIVKVGVDPYDHSPYAHVALTADLKDPSAMLMIVLGEREVQFEPDDDTTQTESPEQQEPDEHEPDADASGEEVVS